MNEVEDRLAQLRQNWIMESDAYKKREIELEAQSLKCYFPVSGMRCNKPVSKIGSYTCDEHKSKYKKTVTKNWTLEQMQERIAEWKNENRVITA